MGFLADHAAGTWLEDEAAAPIAADDTERLELAWALKDRGYAAMYSDLARAQRAARHCRLLARRADDPAAQRQISAVADWLAGAADALQGQAEQAVSRLDAAATEFEAQGLARAAAEAQVPKMVALSMLGRHDEALACGERTLDLFTRLGDERSAGKVDINLGSMLSHQHRHAEAAAHYRRAAVRFARVNDRQHSVMADVGLAGALSWQFEFDEAARIYERADARARAHGLTSLIGIIDSSRGSMELHRGRHGPALRWLAAALRAYEAEGAPQRLAVARMDLAAAYLALNLLPEALSLYEQAIEGCRSSNAPVELAWALAQLALILARLGRYQAALPHLSQARALFEQQRNATGAARVDCHAAAASLRIGEPAQALTLAESAARTLAATGMRGWWLEAQILAAEAQAALQRPQEAWSAFEAALEQATDLPELQARCHTGMGQLLRERGDLAGARARLLLAADTIESQQAQLHGDEFRTAYTTDKQPAFDALIELALDAEGAAALAPLFESMERARSRALRIGLAQGLADANTPPPGTAAAPAGVLQWRQSLHWLQRQGQQAALGGDPARAAALQAQARALEAQALEAWRRADAERARVGGTRALTPPTLAEVQAALGRGNALVEYAWVGDRLAALVIRRDGCTRVDLSPQGLTDRIEQLRFQINSFRFGAPALKRHAGQMQARAQAHLQALYRQVWAPLAPWLDGIDSVVVVPHGALHYLPFCALHDGYGALLDRCAISLAASAQLWLDSLSAPPRPLQQALVLGIGGRELPHVQAEVAEVAAVFGAGARTLLDDNARLAAVQDALGGTDLLHLACHAQFRADSPYYSSLQLSDGPLTLREAAALPLPGAFVTLSACETGLSRVAPGDELVGLVRGFLMAGARTVAASLWTVDDACTAVLMAVFYRALRAGLAPAEALRQAQQDTRAQWPHPYYWGSFVLHGRA